MSKRLISPIIVENESLHICNYESLIACHTDNPRAYALVYFSGDAQRLAHAYGKDTPSPTFTQPLMLDTDTDLFSANGQIYLLGIVYKSFLKMSSHKLSVVGYFRQKSIILLDGDLLIVHDTFISFCTIKGGSITVTKNNILHLTGCFIDNCTIYVEEGGWLGIDDIAFSGSASAAIFVKRGGIIGHYRKVSFFDNHKKFHIECATTETVGSVLDLTNADDVIEFLQDSIVEEFELDSDFNPMIYQDFELHHPVSFTNVSSHPISFSAGTVSTSSSLKISENFFVTMNIMTQETNEIDLRLGNFNGLLSIQDVGSASLKDTKFNNAKIHSDKSSIELSGCSIKGDNVIVAKSTALKIFDSFVYESKNCIVFKPNEASSEDSAINNILELENVSAAKCSNLISGSLDQLSLIRSKNFIACENAINLTGCAIFASEISASESNLFFNLTECAIEGEAVTLSGGNTQCNITKTTAVFKNSHFVAPVDNSFTATASILELHHSVVSGGLNNVLLLEGSELRHLHTSFKNSTAGAISGDYGRKIIDLAEGGYR